MIASYVICTTARSGSTLLCSLLAATGRAGRPDSFYHEPDFMREWAEAWTLPTQAVTSQAEYDLRYLQAVISAGRAGTPYFGMRLQQPYLALLCATLDRLYPKLSSDAERFERAFSRIAYIHLTRRDKVAQAVSLVKARQGGLWHRNADGSERERLSASRDPTYAFSAIRKEVDDLTQADFQWVRWFEANQIVPFRIVYEDFSQRLETTVIDVCTVIGVEPPETGTIKPTLAKLSDAVNVEWAELYRSDLAKLTGVDQHC